MVLPDLDRRARWGFALAVASLLLGAAWASGTAVAAELGPFDSPGPARCPDGSRTRGMEPGRGGAGLRWPHRRRLSPAVAASRRPRRRHR